MISQQLDNNFLSISISGNEEGSIRWMSNPLKSSLYVAAFATAGYIGYEFASDCRVYLRHYTLKRRYGDHYQIEAMWPRPNAPERLFDQLTRHIIEDARQRELERKYRQEIEQLKALESSRAPSSTATTTNTSTSQDKRMK